jgi:hypothetical protein
MITLVSNLKKYLNNLFDNRGRERMRKALIIGVNDYDNIGSLKWCENDAVGMEQALARNADGNLNRPGFIGDRFA